MKKSILFSSALLALSFSGKAQFNGELDSTYAQNGISLIDFGQTTELGVAAKFHPNGKLYYGGVAGGPNVNFLLTRLNNNGTVDNSFGNQGAITYDFSIGGDDYIYDLDISNNGKIVMVGSVPNGGTDQLIAVLKADGSYDTVFNQTGFLITGGSHKDVWQTCLAEANGKVLAAGISSDSQQQDVKVERYNADGTLDLTFGFQGNITVDFSNWETAIKLHRHSSSRYYLLTQTNDYKFTVLAFDQWGQAEANFASGGTLSKTLSNTGFLNISDLITDPQGNLYIIGGFKNAPSDYKALIYKFDNTGAIDSSFGVNGRYLANLSSSTRDFAISGKVLKNGNLLISGLTNVADQNMMTFLLGPDGSLIFNYGQNGTMEYDVPNQKTESQSFMIEDAHGKIYLCGTSSQTTTKLDMIVAKLKTSGNVGLNELNRNGLQVKAYPNPTNGQLSIDISNFNTGNCKVEIFDLHGRVVLSESELAANPTIVVDLTPLPRGLYMARVSGGNEAATFKVQKL